MTIEQILVTSMAVFCYLIADPKTKEAVLIDPAGDYELIMKAIEKHGVKVKWIVNTHGHFDHTSGNDYMMKHTGAQLLIHELEAQNLGAMSNRLLSRLTGGKGSPEPVKYLKDGDTIKIGSVTLTVMHTPGHTEGGICLYAPGHIFTGDTLFTEGYGRTDLAGGSELKLMESIRKILALPNDTVIWPGHHYGRHPKSTVREQKSFYGQ